MKFSFKGDISEALSSLFSGQALLDATAEDLRVLVCLIAKGPHRHPCRRRRLQCRQSEGRIGLF